MVGMESIHIDGNIDMFLFYKDIRPHIKVSATRQGMNVNQPQHKEVAFGVFFSWDGGSGICKDP